MLESTRDEDVQRWGTIWRTEGMRMFKQWQKKESKKCLYFAVQKLFFTILMYSLNQGRAKRKIGERRMVTCEKREEWNTVSWQRLVGNVDREVNRIWSINEVFFTMESRTRFDEQRTETRKRRTVWETLTNRQPVHCLGRNGDDEDSIWIFSPWSIYLSIYIKMNVCLFVCLSVLYAFGPDKC